MEIYEPQEGDLVSVLWLDASSVTNKSFTDLAPERAYNVGVYVGTKDGCHVLRTGIYFDGDENTDPFGDYTLIPMGWGQEFRLIEQARKE